MSMNATGTYTPIPPPESSPQTAALRLTGRVVFWHRHGQTGRQLLCHLDEWELTGLSTGAARGSFLPIGEACQLFLTRLSRRNDTSIALAVAPYSPPHRGANLACTIPFLPSPLHRLFCGSDGGGDGGPRSVEARATSGPRRPTAGKDCDGARVV